MNRRQFLRRSAAAATTAATLGFPALLRSASPNSLLQVAAIGVGGRGATDLRGVAGHPKVKITALCDVDDQFLEPAARLHPDASRHRDWRELLGRHSSRFDAVIIATPDHMHAAPAVTAIRAGKHVYLEKPMATTLHECRVITREAARAGVVTQLGNQGRSSVESRLTVQLLRSGVIGKIKEVILWENKPLSWWPKNTELRAQADPIPPGLHWDLWLGVQQPRPYLADTYHPKHWRAWHGFGVGELGDMGCHHFDTTFEALRLTAPLRVRQTTPGSSGPLWGEKRVVELIFPGSEFTAGPTVQLTWHDGGIEPDRGKIQLPAGLKELPRSATCWIGERGALFKNYGAHRPVVLPEADFPAETYPADPPRQDHYHDWVEAILQGRKAHGDFSHGGPLTEAVLVGAAADRFAGEWLEWDARALRFPNHRPADAQVRRAYRDGWKVKDLG